MTVAKSLGSLFAEEREGEDDPDHEFSHWNSLPDLLLQRIFSYLTIRERYYASQVCVSWNSLFTFPGVWRTFTLYDGLLTKRKFNYYAGWEKVLDHFRASQYLISKGMHVKTLIFQPMSSLFNLYEFLNISYFMFSKLPGTFAKVHTLRFHFSCYLDHQSDDELVFGTGGQFLTMLKKLMGVLSSLRTLELRNLLLEGREGVQLLDDVCVTCCETLKTLILVNITKMNNQLLHPGTFVNLQTLVISPQNIGEELLELIADSRLQDMHIVQNKYTENSRALPRHAWRSCRRRNIRLRVHLRLEGKAKKRIMLQPGAPVQSVIYDSPYISISVPEIMEIVEQYKCYLEVFAFKQLPRFHMPSAFHQRADSALVFLVRQCPFVRTLKFVPIFIMDILQYVV